MMSLINSIASEEIDSTPYNIVRNPKPVVESVMLFDDAKVDLGKWSKGLGVETNDKKVGEAKTAPTKKVEQVTEQIVTDDKKEDGKVVALETTVESKTSEEPKAGNGGSFDKAAKSATSDQQKEADDNKHFEENAKKQTKLNEMFRNHIKSLMVDESSIKDGEKILKKFDEIHKFMTSKK